MKILKKIEAMSPKRFPQVGKNFFETNEYGNYDVKKYDIIFCHSPFLRIMVEKLFKNFFRKHFSFGFIYF